MKQLRPYQQEAIDSIHLAMGRGITKSLLVLATGLGKTVTAVKTADSFDKTLFIVDSEELIDQAAYSFLREKFDDRFMQMVQEMGFMNYIKKPHFFAGQSFKMGAIKADVFDPTGNVVISSIQTLHNRLHKLSPEMFDLVVVDEAHCLPKGAMIDGVPIENIKEGDFVRSYNHELGICEYKEVTGCYKGVCENDLIEIFLENGESVVCTDNHPIYTKEYGYIKAKSVCFKQMGELSLYYETNFYKNDASQLFCLQQRNGDFGRCKNKGFSAVSESVLFDCVQTEENRNVQESIQSELQNLSKRSFFCNKSRKEQIQNWCSLLQQRVFQNKKKKRHGCTESYGGQRENVEKNEREQSYVKYGNKTKNDKLFKRKNFFVSWWERRIHQASNDAAFGNRISYGAPNKHIGSKTLISKCAKFIQSRLSRTFNKTSNRSRWENTPAEKMEVFGQKKNGNSQFFRVDGYKIYKRGSRDFFVKMREENYVYNIEVKGNNNYFVNGILLHNCYMAATFFKGVNFFQPKLRLGLTATPERHDGLSLSDLFDEITFEYNIADGIRDGYLVELDAIKVETNCSLDKVRTTAGDLNNKDLSNEINTLARNNLIADKWLKHAKGRKTIAFCCNIQHALDLCDAFLMKGISATAISSDEELTGDRTKKVKDFKDGKYEVIFNVNILTKGYDQPDVSCIIAAAPTKSKTRYMQAIGRGTRVLPGVIDNLETDVERWKAIKASDKKDCLILDIVDLTSKHNIVNTWTLDKGLDPEDRVFITQEKRELLLEHRRQKNSKLEHVQEKDERVKLLRIPKVVVVDSIKNREGATQKQLEWIYRLGYDQTAHYTKGMVAEILNKLPATKEDVQDLIKLGYDVDGKVITRGDVNAVRWEIQKKSKNKYK